MGVDKTFLRRVPVVVGTGACRVRTFGVHGVAEAFNLGTDRSSVNVAVDVHRESLSA